MKIRSIRQEIGAVNTDRFAVVIDPDVWTDPRWSELSPRTRWAYLVLLSWFGAERLFDYGDLPSDITRTDIEELARGGVAVTTDPVLGFRLRLAYPLRARRPVDVERARVTASQRRDMIAAVGSRCQVCNTLTQEPHVDHIVPLNLGGSSDQNNLWVLCGDCNRAKRDHPPYEWLTAQNVPDDVSALALKLEVHYGLRDGLVA